MLRIPVVFANPVARRVRFDLARFFGPAAPLLLSQQPTSRGGYRCWRHAAECHLGLDRVSLIGLKFLLLSAEGLLGADACFVPHHVHAVSHRRGLSFGRRSVAPKISSQPMRLRAVTGLSMQIQVRYSIAVVSRTC